MDTYKLLTYVRGLVTHSPQQLLFVYSCLEKEGFRAVSVFSREIACAQSSHVPYFVVFDASLWESVAIMCHMTTKTTPKRWKRGIPK